MASPAFGTSSIAGGSTAANVTISVPPSTADGDFLLTVISKDTTEAITVPSGWTLLWEDTANTFHVWVGYRIASSEPTNYTWSFVSTWRDAYMLRFTGEITSAPLDPATPATGTTGATVSTLTTPANTIATDATRVIAVHTSKTLNAWPAATATVDGTTMTVHTSTGAVEVHVMSGAKALATGSEAGKAQAITGTAGAMKAYMLVIASVAPAGAFDPSTVPWPSQIPDPVQVQLVEF